MRSPVFLYPLRPTCMDVSLAHSSVLRANRLATLCATRHPRAGTLCAGRDRMHVETTYEPGTVALSSHALTRPAAVYWELAEMTMAGSLHHSHRMGLPCSMGVIRSPWSAAGFLR